MTQPYYLPSGMLKPSGLGSTFHLERFAPSAETEHLVLRYWLVVWDVPEQLAYAQETLPYPCVNLVVERGRSGIFGVNTRRFQVQLSGQGRVFGIKFRPGAFYPFYRTALTSLTDRTIDIVRVFGAAGRMYEQQVLACTGLSAMIECAEQFLRTHMPPPDAQLPIIQQAIEQIAADRTITRVKTIAELIGVSPRTLQRWFRQYVGVSPKWVIQRYRLLEAVDQLTHDQQVDLPTLAQTLGYFDQAHFINDFRDTIGSTPAMYAEL